jgi:hypothetical protein
MFQEVFQFCGIELQVMYFLLLHAYIIDHCKHFVTLL